MNILITGANRGLGLALVTFGLQNGHTVYAGVREIDEDKIKHLRGLGEQFKGQLTILSVDVTRTESILMATQQVDEKLDVIINNAGILNERDNSIEDLDIEAFKLAFDVNTFGPIRVIKHFLPLLKKGNKQSIINISSDSGSLLNASIKDYPYGLSKAALNMLSEKLHLELIENDIQVVAVHPGWMHTDMGGDSAPTNPIDSAKGIYKIIDERNFIDSKSVFTDYRGKPMDL